MIEADAMLVRTPKANAVALDKRPIEEKHDCSENMCVRLSARTPTENDTTEIKREKRASRSLAVVLFTFLLLSFVPSSCGDRSYASADPGAKSAHSFDESSMHVQFITDPLVKTTVGFPERSEVGAPDDPAQPKSGDADSFSTPAADNNPQGFPHTSYRERIPHTTASSPVNTTSTISTATFTKGTTLHGNTTANSYVTSGSTTDTMVNSDTIGNASTVAAANSNVSGITSNSSTTVTSANSSISGITSNSSTTVTSANINTSSIASGTVTTASNDITSSFSTTSPTSSSNIINDITSISNINVTTVPLTNNTAGNDSSINPDSSPGGKCHEMCTCPDYPAWSKYLVPDLRRLMGVTADNYTDDVLELFLMKQFLTNAESHKSILFPLVATLLSSGRPMQALGLQWAREGVTNCHLKSNITFYLDAAAEASLFPQVEFKVAQEKASALTNAQEVPGSPDSSFPREAVPRYEGSQLYNISFTCVEGAKVVVTKQASLYRYGRWQNSRCEILTEGQLVQDRNLSLIELIVGNATASWLQNITVSGNEDNPPVLTNLTDIYPYNNVSVNNNTMDMVMNKGTIFPSVRAVMFLYTSLSVEQLSHVLTWFQKANSLSLIYNGLGNFSCRQLLPSPAAWTKLTLVQNGLKSVPACILRPSLVSLNLSYNAISDISVLQYPRVVPAPNMSSLILNDNEISDVGILSDMNVTLLYLAGNRISTLNKLSFNRLPSLGLLDLSRNQLHRLDPGSFKALMYLMYLDLRDNQLQHFDRSVSPIRVGPPLTCKIYLQNNRLAHPPFQSNIYDPGNSLLVYSAGNPFACDCNMTDYVVATSNSSLTSSYVDRADMRCVFPTSMAGVHLDQVYFNESCPVVSRCPPGCACALSRDDHVVTVDCTEVEHFRLPSEAPETYPLRVEFQGTSGEQTLLSIKDSEYLRRVISFNMSGRGLTAVPDFLCEALPQAHLLDLSHNKLRRLPECFHNRSEDWPALELRLSHNPWSCDCEALSFGAWLAAMLDGQVRLGVRVSDADEVWCSSDTQPGVRVADWDSSDCEVINYLPWAVTLGVTLGLAVVLGPVLYVYRLQAMVAIHAHLHVRPFAARHRFNEEDYDYEAVVVHGKSDTAVNWVVNTLLPRAGPDTRLRHHRLCIPERDFLPGCVMSESHASAVTRSKCTVCLLSRDAARNDEWWLYAFQLARAENARRPNVRLLLVLLEPVEEAELPEDVRDFLKSNTYLDMQDKWFWKKLCYYLPDPPRMPEAPKL